MDKWDTKALDWAKRKGFNPYDKDTFVVIVQPYDRQRRAFLVIGKPSNGGRFAARARRLGGNNPDRAFEIGLRDREAAIAALLAWAEATSDIRMVNLPPPVGKSRTARELAVCRAREALHDLLDPYGVLGGAEKLRRSFSLANLLARELSLPELAPPPRRVSPAWARERRAIFRNLFRSRWHRQQEVAATLATIKGLVKTDLRAGCAALSGLSAKINSAEAVLVEGGPGWDLWAIAWGDGDWVIKLDLFPESYVSSYAGEGGGYRHWQISAGPSFSRKVSMLRRSMDEDGPGRAIIVNQKDPWWKIPPGTPVSVKLLD